MAAPAQPLLLVFDVHALVHRAYHAVDLLTVRRTGEVVNAVFGFTSTLLKTLNDFRPTYLAAANDLPGPTFRHESFDSYKANRVAAPDDLRSQFRRVRELLEAFCIPIYEEPGFEADDVIGALVGQAAAQQIPSIVVTGDNDALQLVGPYVRVLTPRRTMGDTILYDEAAVRERFGLEPAQLVDFKGLKGDPSDNIPGVPGIGEKTAIRLLQEFGSIDELYARLDEVKLPRLPRIQDLLREYEAQCRQSRDLARIETDLPVRLDLERSSVTQYDRARVVELFRELEFTSLLSRLPRALGADPETAAVPETSPDPEAAVADQPAQADQGSPVTQGSPRGEGVQLALFESGAHALPAVAAPAEEGYRIVRSEA